MNQFVIIVGAALFAVLAAAAPSRAEQSYPTETGPAILGPTCKLMTCWAVVIRADGKASVIRARGYMATLRLAEREFARQAAIKKMLEEVPCICPSFDNYVRVRSRRMSQIHLGEV